MQPNQTVSNRPAPPPAQGQSLMYIAAGSSGEAIAGIIAIILAIIGLCGVMTRVMNSVGIIVAGAALFLEGATIASQFRRLSVEMAAQKGQEVTLGSSISLEAVGGLAGIVLGALALANVKAAGEVSAACIVVGAALALGSLATAKLDRLHLHWHTQQDKTDQLAHQSLMTAAAIQAVTGIAALILGIFATAHYSPTLLHLIGVLCIGVGVLVTGAAVAAKAKVAEAA